MLGLTFQGQAAYPHYLLWRWNRNATTETCCSGISLAAARSWAPRIVPKIATPCVIRFSIMRERRLAMPFFLQFLGYFRP
jgi:hypothetical protein